MNPKLGFYTLKTNTNTLCFRIIGIHDYNETECKLVVQWFDKLNGTYWGHENGLHRIWHMTEENFANFELFEPEWSKE